jgi:hypothetical protein
MKFNSDQNGHWYKCKKSGCGEHIPLPDTIFDADYRVYSIPAECKAGHINVFKITDALSPTRKWKVDKYFSVKQSKSKIVVYWS